MNLLNRNLSSPTTGSSPINPLTKKPYYGMLLKALTDFNRDINQAWIVGDRPRNKQAPAAVRINFMWADICQERWRTGEYRV